MRVLRVFFTRNSSPLKAAMVMALLIVGVLASCQETGNAQGTVVEFKLKPQEILRYSVLISETVYRGSERTANLYREEMTVEVVSASNNQIKQVISCSGTHVKEGGEASSLGRTRYTITMTRNGRILSAEGLRPWDKRIVESIWLFSVMLPERPVSPGDGWEINDKLLGAADGRFLAERRKYTLRSVSETSGGLQFVVDYTVSRTGRHNGATSTYMNQGTFHFLNGRVVRLQGSEVLTEAGNNGDENVKVITMIQVDLIGS
ncbi:MAG TPA: hypothetical protein GX509_00785 [Firmicutes bacterium]|nr:hypothetical protein [Bacillota bacterium]